MSKLDFKEVSKELNIMLNKRPRDGQVRNVVFWFDGEGEFRDKLEELDLENAKIMEFTGKNYFEIKYTLEVTDLTSNYLIYSPFYKPNPQDNYLLDICLYSQEFEADITTIYMREFEIDNPALANVIKKYKNFLNSKERRNKLKSYNIKKWNENIIHIAVLCAVCKLNVVDFEEALMCLLSDYINEGELLQEVKKYCDIDTLDTFVENKFGITNAFEDVDNLMTNILLLHTSLYLKSPLPNSWKINLPDTNNFAIKNNAYIFVDRFMKSDYAESFIAISNKVAEKIQFERITKDWDIEAYEDVDTFIGYDLHIIRNIRDCLTDNVKEFDRYLSIIKQRRKSYWNDTLKYEYQTLHHACKFLSKVDEESKTFPQGTSEILLEKYVKNYFKFDQYYREFVTAYDKAENEDFSELFNKIENTYTNWYLNELSVKWSNELKLINYTNLNAVKQWDFYSKFVKPCPEKIAIIISDALRYECGEELNKRISNAFKVKSTLNFAVSTLPSYTALGMASLLPHNKIEYAGADVYVDGINSSSIENREKILNTFVEGKVYKFEEFNKPQNSVRIKSEIAGQKVIYIYHDSIDAMGDKTSTENKVFVGVEDAFNEIQSIVKKLQNFSITNIIITADHGFIYKRNDIEEMDKTPNEIENSIISKRRFILTKDNIEPEMSRKISLDYLLKNTDINVVIPYGVNIYKKQGESKKYVHGGDCLQEIVIPIIQIDNRRSQRDKYTAKNVTISCVSLSNKITSLITFLEFFQNEKVSEKLLPRNYEVYFEDEEGKRISNSVVINADSKSEDVKDRMCKEKFTLRNQKYDKNKQYYLVVSDYDDSYAERTNLPFTIDILIENDFDL